MRVALTGAAGFLGRYVSEYCDVSECDVSECDVSECDVSECDVS